MCATIPSFPPCPPTVTCDHLFVLWVAYPIFGARPRSLLVRSVPLLHLVILTGRKSQGARTQPLLLLALLSEELKLEAFFIPLPSQLYWKHQMTMRRRIVRGTTVPPQSILEMIPLLLVAKTLLSRVQPVAVKLVKPGLPRNLTRMRVKIASFRVPLMRIGMQA